MMGSPMQRSDLPNWPGLQPNALRGSLEAKLRREKHHLSKRHPGMDHPPPGHLHPPSIRHVFKALRRIQNILAPRILTLRIRDLPRLRDEPPAVKASDHVLTRPTMQYPFSLRRVS